MSNFHNKYHRHTHQTASTGLVDSAMDPIASPDAPFVGDFYLDGKLVIHGDISISGDLDMNNYILSGYSATSAITGVVRIATDAEAIARTATDCILTPKSLEYVSSVLASHAIDGSGVVHHTDVSATSASFGQTITYSSSASGWKNADPYETVYMGATSGEALSGADNVWVSPAQLHLEIMRHMPKYGTYFFYHGWYAPVNQYTDHTLKFTPRSGDFGLDFSGVQIHTSSGSGWIST